ncbi:MAG: hypothetical protein IKE89_00275 [Bacilli bacterium]|nr:hypothetical protein [Bacilli bacterium]
MTREEVNENLQEDIDLEEKIKNRKKIVLNIIKIIILIIVLFILFFFINKYINTGIIEVSEHRIINEKIPDNFNGIKIIQVSDIKYGSNINNDDIKKLVKIINERKPDIVLYTGNLIDDEYKLDSKEREKIINSLQKIDASLGKYAVYGDEDKEDFMTIMNQSGFTILNNSKDLIYNEGNTPITLVGLDIYSKSNLNESFKDINNSFYTIVIANSDYYVDDLIKFKPNLVLVGGNSNGYIRLPGIGGLIRGEHKYTNPYYEKEGIKIYVSSGIGTDNIGIRFNNLPSINFFRISNK